MTRQPLFEVRNSPVHGLGAFALRRISKGTRIVEYLGERVSHREADRRYEGKDADDAHTFLFIVDSKTVIDAGVGGNEARFLNHSCNPNCESVIENRRVFIEAIRTIEPGEEMTYDYQIQREDDDPPGIEEVFACHCGFPQCRGTMLWPPDPPKSASRKPKRKPPATKQTRQARQSRQTRQTPQARRARQAESGGGRRDRDAGNRGRKSQRERGTARKSSRRR